MSSNRDEDAPTREMVEEALSALACPYYRGEGVCVTGCYSEPSCHTDEPLGGWESVAAHAPRWPGLAEPWGLLFEEKFSHTTPEEGR